MNFNEIKKVSLLVPMGNFDKFGGWSLDTQFIEIMGAPYLLAHGLGEPVEDAKTSITFPSVGTYRTFVYTFNWVAPWKPEYSPGIFNVLVNDVCLNKEFGKTATRWDWEEGATIEITNTSATLALHDLTGFEGRCGFVFFTKDETFSPPPSKGEIINMHKALTNYETAQDMGKYDIVVCGAGIAGICAALSSARNGLKTALVQDRLLVGGNNSSEVRVWLGGGTNYAPFEGIGNIVGELEPQKAAHYGSDNIGELYEDKKRLDLVLNQENLDCFLGHILMSVDNVDGKIAAINTLSYKENTYKNIRADLFVDCTGDSILGSLAGADYEVTTNGHMGMTNVWHIKKDDTQKDFPHCPWAVDLTNVKEFPGRGETKDVYDNQGEKSLGCWFWESGCELDPIEYAEFSRDMNFRAMYGAWDCLRNTDNSYEGYNLSHSCYIGGKRESRRILGTLVLTKPDVSKDYAFPDGCVPSTWNFDVHYPDKRFYAAFYEGDGFLTKDYREIYEGPFFIPYRCLYSRNISNLFMAGRNVSVSHDALGTARIMRTGGMMGEVVGYAAGLCKKYNALPNDIYEKHLDELLDTLKKLPNKEVFKANGNG